MSTDVSSVNGRPTLVTNAVHGVKTTETKQVSPEASRRPDAHQDSVEITDTAAQMRKIEAALETQPIVDRNKVEAFRTAISEGRYTVPAEEIAQKFFDIESAIEKS